MTENPRVGDSIPPLATISTGVYSGHMGNAFAFTLAAWKSRLHDRIVLLSFAIEGRIQDSVTPI